MATRRKKYGLPTVERVELTERRFSLRALLAGLGIALALAVLGWSLHGLLGGDAGWREIESDGSRGIHCGGDFTFRANVSGAAELKRLTLTWTEATRRAWQLFDVTQADGDAPNLAWLNAHPGEDVRLDPGLIRALRQAAEGGRYLYLAPVYDLHRSLCACQSDPETQGFDPLRDADARDFCARAAAFARDPESVNLTFPSADTARLTLSDAYAAFLRENGCPGALDFGWMKNAFVIDYLAQAVLDAGFTRGAISSRDGFVRCLDDSGERYAIRLFELREGRPWESGVLNYTGPAALATLHSFRLDPVGERNYYVYGDGDTRAPHVDPSDGLPRAATPSLTGASRTLGCGALLTRLLPLYIADTFAPEAGEDFALVWPGDGWLSTDPSFAAEGR